MDHRRATTGTGALAALACVLSIGSLAASGGEPDVTRTAPSRAVSQDQLEQLNSGEALNDPREDAAAAVEAASDELADLGIANEVPEAVERPQGFGSLAVDIPDRTITIRWKGDAPDSIKRVAGDNPKVTITVIESPYTDDELTKTGIFVFDQLTEEIGEKGYVSIVSQINDGSGLNATVVVTDSTITEENLRKAIQKITSIPVVLTIQAEDSPDNPVSASAPVS